MDYEDPVVLPIPQPDGDQQQPKGRFNGKLRTAINTARRWIDTSILSSKRRMLLTVAIALLVATTAGFGVLASWKGTKNVVAHMLWLNPPSSQGTHPTDSGASSSYGSSQHGSNVGGSSNSGSSNQGGGGNNNGGGTPPPPPPATSNLHVSGSQILDATGKSLLLRGAQIPTEFNQSWKGGGTISTYLSAQALASMHNDWHMNVLRLPVAAYYYQQQGYMALLDQVVQTANKAGLYVVLANFEDNQAGGGTSVIDQTGLTMWQFMAQHYKSNPMILFDLINEPKYTDWGQWLDGGGGTIGFRQTLAAIRAAGAGQLIIVEPGPNSNGWQGFDPAQLADTNIVYSHHNYGSVATGNPQVWDAEWGNLLNTRPIYYGEWALLPHPNHPSFCQGVTWQNADQITNTFLAYMQSRHANWTAWDFKSTNLIQDEVAFMPTSFHSSAPWTCNSPEAAKLGMGEDVKSFLATH